MFVYFATSTRQNLCRVMMPRIRNIKPQFWLDEDLGQVPRDIRLLYIGLWNLCDDYGVFEWRPSRIKVQLFPYDVDISGKEIASWLDKLEEIKKISQFKNNDKNYGYIPGFPRHQDIKNPSKWRFAIPPETGNTPALLQPYPSSTPALPVGNRLKVIGYRSIGKKKREKPLKQKFGEFLNVFLTTEEHEKLINKFGVVGTSNWIESLSAHLKSVGKPRKYEDHYATILNWARRDKKEGKGGAYRQSSRELKPRQDYKSPEEHRIAGGG